MSTRFEIQQAQNVVNYLQTGLGIRPTVSCGFVTFSYDGMDVAITDHQGMNPELIRHVIPCNQKSMEDIQKEADQWNAEYWKRNHDL